jgi:membrane protease YdiL (CAAX protease family)
MDSQPEVPPAQPPRSFPRSIFIGPNGIRAGWRFLIFVLLVIAFQVVVRVVVRHIPPLYHILNVVQKGVLTPGFELTFESITIATIFLAAFIMSNIEGRSFACYGIPLWGAFGKRFWQGVIWGLALESIEMLLMYALGGFSFGGLAIFGAAILRFGLLWALGFTLVGIAEEFTFRGYPQFTLTTGMGFWPSAILLSALFGLVHLSNPGEGWVGALSVMLFGLFACFTLQRTGNLWFAIGLHAAADFAETFIYSVPDSGMLATGHLINSSLHGPKWLTGGAIGPEGSVIDFALFLASFVLFALLYPAKEEHPAPVPAQ